MHFHFAFICLCYFVCGSAKVVALNNNVTDIQIIPIWSPSICSRSVKTGDFVRYHYYGMLTNGKWFDSSFQRKRTYNTYVGSGWLIEGMDKGLLGMCLNEHRLIKIPPHLAYGDKEADDGLIPANSTLLFNTILLDLWNDEDDIKIEINFKPADCERMIEVSDYVRYHYNGTLLNGKPFHSSYDDERTFDTYIGQGWLIKGMDQGLVGACQGERRRITIPPHKAYGEKGDGKRIPPFATVVFDVKIIDFHNPKDDVVVNVTKPVEGCPRRLETTDFVRYHYNGTLADGTVFDTSYERGRTYDTYMGFRRIIPGMEKGLLGACMGEFRSITFPPHLGYGEQGVQGKIPPSAVLTFHVHVIDFHNPNDDVDIQVISMPENCDLDTTRKAEEHDYLTYDYVLRLMDGEVLESSSDSTSTLASFIGKGHLVPGIEKGLLGMCAGEVRRVVIPPHIGYGEFGQDGLVPGSAVLDFTFELHKIEPGVPDGYTFFWVDRGDIELLKGMDEDEGGDVTIDEFSSFIFDQVENSRARLMPGVPREELVVKLFKELDRNKDEILSAKELSGGLGPRSPAKIDDEL